MRTIYAYLITPALLLVIGCPASRPRHATVAVETDVLRNPTWPAPYRENAVVEHLEVGRHLMILGEVNKKDVNMYQVRTLDGKEGYVFQVFVGIGGSKRESVDSSMMPPLSSATDGGH